MAGTQRTTATTRPRKAAKKPAARANYTKLLKLARKLKPPQRWYDETTNPFRPKRVG